MGRPHSIMVWAGLALAAGLAGSTGVIGAPDAATTADPNVIDRTVVCKTGVGLGARTINISAYTGREGERFFSLGSVSVSTPGQGSPTSKNYRPLLVGMSAGWPAAPPFSAGSLSFSTKLCEGTRAQVALRTRGLKGGDAPVFPPGLETKCYATERVLVRFRATFFAPPTLSHEFGKDALSETARIAKGQLVVRTTAGKRLVYAEVYDSRKARLFTAGSCF